MKTPYNYPNKISSCVPSIFKHYTLSNTFKYTCCLFSELHKKVVILLPSVPAPYCTLYRRRVDSDLPAWLLSFSVVLHRPVSHVTDHSSRREGCAHLSPATKFLYAGLAPDPIASISLSFSCREQLWFCLPLLTSCILTGVRETGWLRGV